MTYDETVKLTALGNRYRELSAEASEVRRELNEASSRKRQLENKLRDLKAAIEEIVYGVEPIFAGVQCDDPEPIVVSSVAPSGEKAEA